MGGWMFFWAGVYNEDLGHGGKGGWGWMGSKWIAWPLCMFFWRFLGHWDRASA